MPTRTGANTKTTTRSRPATRTKICIVGFTPSRREAPWADPTWQVWGINNLHLSVPEAEHASFWFDLHDTKLIQSDPAHEQWLRTTKIPVYMWTPRDEWPTSIPYPKEEVLERFGRRYFTNSIAWMIAFAIMQDPSDIAIVGVDMAQHTEYSAQRPSCEWIIGVAEGLGIKVSIPESSDLLKSASLYGAESDNALRAKLLERKADLEERLAGAQQVRAEAEAAMHQMHGALEDCNYWLGVWTQPQISRDGNASQEASGE